jgi:uncharacterized Rmd1/YagE family protein
MYIFPFGAVVMVDVAPEHRGAVLLKLGLAMPKLTRQVIREDYTVLEDPALPIGIVDGRMQVDAFTPARAGVVALTVGQSAAMEYYERIADQHFTRILGLFERLERRGTVPFRLRSLHRLIGEAVVTRTEVLAVLHLLDKPDAAWDDPAIDRIYDDLRAEFDLGDRWAALESKARSIQDSAEILLGVARDRRLVLLEIIVALLIALEIILSIAHFT